MTEYFSGGIDREVTFHDTAEAAKTVAEESLDVLREEADDGWSEDVHDICWEPKKD